MLKKCCCCIELRRGSILLGILCTILGLATFIFGTFIYSSLVPTYFQIIYLPIMFSSIFYVVTHGCLWFGAVNYDTIAIMVYLVCQAFMIVGIIGFCIVLMTLINNVLSKQAAEGCGVKDNPSCNVAIVIINIIVAEQFLIILIINIYFWICIYSFYLNLKEGTENIA